MRPRLMTGSGHSEVVKKMEVPRRTRMVRLPSNEARAWERTQVGRCTQMDELSGMTTGLCAGGLHS